MADPRLDYPATTRNREPILSVLRQVLPEVGSLLEIASGSGQHAAYFAPAFPGLRWQPTDFDASVLASIRAWTHELPNVASPLRLDVTSQDWPTGPFDAVFCANMIHIAPWEACLGLIDGVSKRLRAGSPMCLYGPFMREGVHTAPSNAAFDAQLRARNSTWGVRDLDTVANAAIQHKLALNRVFEMPSNNLLVVFRQLQEP